MVVMGCFCTQKREKFRAQKKFDSHEYSLSWRKHSQVHVCRTLTSITLFRTLNNFGQKLTKDELGFLAEVS